MMFPNTIVSHSFMSVLRLSIGSGSDHVIRIGFHTDLYKSRPSSLVILAEKMMYFNPSLVSYSFGHSCPKEAKSGNIISAVPHDERVVALTFWLAVNKIVRIVRVINHRFVFITVLLARLL